MQFPIHTHSQSKLARQRASVDDPGLPKEQEESCWVSTFSLVQNFPKNPKILVQKGTTDPKLIYTDQPAFAHVLYYYTCMNGLTRSSFSISMSITSLGRPAIRYLNTKRQSAPSPRATSRRTLLARSTSVCLLEIRSLVWLLYLSSRLCILYNRNSTGIIV